uniref:Saposin B-type domain-containing protein n=1 Tax=Cyprinus carpio TaxID=7962 RepID=A0A8C2D9L4_CYPCA
MYYICLAFFLTVCALHWEMQKEDSTGNELEKGSGEIQTEQQPGICKVCKLAMKKLKKQISNGATLVCNSSVSYAFNKNSCETNSLMLILLVTFLQDDVKKKLAMVCDEIDSLKSLCRKFVYKYKDTLVEELSTTDDARTICINIGVCKKWVWS